MNNSDISIILRTAEYRGDHSADISIAHGLREGETVAELVERLLTAGKGFAPDQYSQWLEIRRIKHQEDDGAKP